MTVSSAGDQQLPAEYKRLVAKRTGASFAEVAEVEQVPLPQPGPKEVQCTAWPRCTHQPRHSSLCSCLDTRVVSTHTACPHLQVLVRMLYAGINGGCETFRVRGEGAFTANKAKEEGYSLGAEGAGVVAAVGPDVTGLFLGQAVACNGAAAFSEYGITQAAMCTPLQQATPEAVALTLSGMTAAAALEHTAKVQPGEVVLVTAAAGGTGHFAVQLAQLAGARVVAVAGSDAKKQKLQALGLERVINYKQEVGHDFVLLVLTPEKVECQQQQQVAAA